MMRRLREHHRLYETLFMGLLSLLCFGMSLYRVLYTDTEEFLFMNWNLFLAFLPWGTTSIFIVYPKIQQRRVLKWGLVAMWLLFFPNAPYVLTDLFHLRIDLGMPIWFDAILILSYAWTGLLFGVFSLWDIDSLICKTRSKTFRSVVVSLLLFIGAFGIYLGRYLRWNSWDILVEPLQIIFDLGDRFINPLAHPRTWGMTIYMGIFLNIVYWSLTFIRNKMHKRE